MRIVVTRPLVQGEKTAQKLKDLGHEPVLLPLTKAMHFPDVARAALLEPHCGLVITSSEALRCLELVAPVAERAPPLAEREWHRPLFAVGMATATAAADAGFTNVLASSGDGRQLAGVISQYYQDHRPAEPLLYLAGVPRAARFETALQSVKIDLMVAEIYEMIRLEPLREQFERDSLDRQVDVVLLYSRETALAFSALVGSNHPSLENALFLCLGRSMADVLPKAWRKRILVAARPDEEALLDLL